MISISSGVSAVDFLWGGGAGTDPFGVPTSDADAFWQKHMQKQKNWVLGGTHQWHPLDPPHGFHMFRLYNQPSLDQFFITPDRSPS